MREEAIRARADAAAQGAVIVTLYDAVIRDLDACIQEFEDEYDMRDRELAQRYCARDRGE